MRLPGKWDEAGILELIDQRVQESLVLDYKACAALDQTDAKSREVSKDVSAFANFAGGTIVYGVLEDGHFPASLDAGYLPNKIGKEWIENVIHGNIQRRIDGIVIDQVWMTGERTGKVLYVVSIPQSVRAPHMAADHKFYKRFNFQSVPMEEYEVRDTSRRSEAPDLWIEVQAHVPDPRILAMDFIVSIFNDAPEPAYHAVITLYVDNRLHLLSTPNWSRFVHSLTASDGRQVEVQQMHVNWSANSHMPVWQGQSFRVNEQRFAVALPAGPGNYAFGWRLSSPRMAEKQKYYRIESNGATVRLVEQ